jgi:glycosyltransferase involved in cell wall biosynthesis
MINVNLIFRKSNPSSFSIEKVFLSLLPELEKHIKVNLYETPFNRASPLVIFKNCMFFRKLKFIRHITGDVHYLAIYSGKHTVLTIHDVGSINNGCLLKRLYLRVFWLWLPCLFVSRITVVSEFTKAELSRIAPFARNKIFVIPNPVGSNFQHNPKKCEENLPVILFVGTKQNKNLDRTLEAIKNLNCQIHIIGPLSVVQENFLIEKGILYKNSINITNEEIIEAYNNCDVLCFPSTYEGFGMPIIEAQAIGRPVVTSNFGAMKEVARNSACLVDPFSVNSIREGLKSVLEDSNYYDELIELGRQNVKFYQPELIARQYLKIYKEISEINIEGKST